MKASDLFIKALENEGVEYIFGLGLIIKEFQTLLSLFYLLLVGICRM